ncbi:MAG: tetratricopeptide repeat protein [Rhodospirillaceae bacterium]
MALGELGEQAACIASCERALAVDPGYARAWYNIGNARRARNERAAAVACYRRALALEPDFSKTWNNLGIVLGELGRPDEAMTAYRQALALEPGDASQHMNIAFMLLLKGRYAEGWQEFEWRWLSAKYAPHRYARPLWRGEPLPGRTLLLHAEQGMGDTLQFVRYAAWARERTGRVLVRCQTPLVPLLASATGVDAVFGENEPLPAFDAHAPLMGLPKLHGTDASTIPAAIPYLFAEAGRIGRFRLRFDDIPGLRIGIVWQGNPNHVGDRLRSFPLARFEPLAALPGVHLFSLQQGSGAEQLAAAAGRFPVTDLSPYTRDFRDLAAALRALDLVITCDTAVAHAAGALGVPVFLPAPALARLALAGGPHGHALVPDHAALPAAGVR